MAVAREGVPISRGTRGGTSFAAIQVLKWVMVALFLVFLPREEDYDDPPQLSAVTSAAQLTAKENS